MKLLLNTADIPWMPTSKIRIGDMLTLKAKLYPNRRTDQSSENPFSYQSFLHRRGILATGYVSNVLSFSPHHQSHSYKYDFARSLYAEHGPMDALSVALAVILAEKSTLGKHTKELFRMTGLAHLLVISGFHIGLVYLCAFRFSRWLCCRSHYLLLFIPADIPAAAVGLCAAAIYTFTAGASPTTLRAFLVILLLALGHLVGRFSNSSRTLIAVFLLLLFIWPGVFFEAGFQLTFSALTGLLLAHKLFQVKNLDSSQGSPLRRLRNLFVYCFFAWLATAPVLLCWFNTLVPLGSLFNVAFALPFCFLCVGGGALSLLAMFTQIPGAVGFAACCFEIIELLLIALAKCQAAAESMGLGFHLYGPSEARVVACGLAACYALSFLCFVYRHRQRALDFGRAVVDAEVPSVFND